MSGVIRKYAPGDEAEICKLHDAVFPESGAWSVDFWKWRYRGAPDDTFVGAEGAGLNGHLGASPRRISVDGNETTCAIVTDAMIRPEARTQGVFLKLLLACTGNLKGKYPFAYSYMNGNSFPLFNKLVKWAAVGKQLPVLARPLNFRSLLGKKLGPIGAPLSYPVSAIFNLLFPAGKNLNRFTYTHVTEFDGRFGRLWERCPYKKRVSLVRDAAYLNWRYAQSPVPYRNIAMLDGTDLKGFSVYRTVDRFGLKLGIILELVTGEADETVRRALLNRTLRELRNEGADMATCLSFPSSSWNRNLRRAGFFRVPERLMPHPLFLCVGGFTDPKLDLLRDPANWYISYGDVDSV